MGQRQNYLRIQTYQTQSAFEKNHHHQIYLMAYNLSWHLTTIILILLYLYIIYDILWG